MRTLFDTNDFYQLNYIEFYDDKLQQTVYYAKNYRPGDVIIVTDQVYEVVYIEEHDYTSLVFRNEEMEAYSSIEFRGNLSHINAGDVLTFSFTVVPFKNDFFMNLDVNIYHLETNTLPDINDYLIGND